MAGLSGQLAADRTVRLGPGCPPDWPWQAWADLLAPASLLATVGFDAGLTAAAMRAAGSDGLVTVRVGQFETVLGPAWRPGGAAGCPGCAEIFQQASGAAPVGDPAALGPWAADLVEVVLRAGIEPGEVVTVSAAGHLRRHQLGRAADCPHCGGATPARPAELRSRPACENDPTRQGNSLPELAAAVRQLTGGRRFGSMRRHARHSRARLPLTEIGLRAEGRAGAGPLGMGRGSTVRGADDLAVLEAFERLGGFPAEGRLVREVSRRSLGTVAVPLRAFGGYTEQQLRSPACRIRECTDDTLMDWAWARSLTDDEPRLVPADLGYPWHRYPDPEPQPGVSRRDHYFLESSSGTALGAGVEEALLHALFECVERDAFQLAWHRRQPLTGIDHASVTDPESRLLINVIEREGFDVHLLVATADVPLPVVWALAVNRSGGVPACFNTAGANPDPARAVRSALWELAGQAGTDVYWDPAEVRPSVADPWAVRELADHWRRYTDPELLPRVLCCVGPDRVALRDAFGDGPAAFRAAARGDLLAGVRFVAGLLAEAGLPEVFFVDQTTAGHAAAGLAVVRALVPGLIPLTFGHAHQRYAGLPRLLAGPEPAALPFDPHPFP